MGAIVQLLSRSDYISVFSSELNKNTAMIFAEYSGNEVEGLLSRF